MQVQGQVAYKNALWEEWAGFLWSLLHTKIIQGSQAAQCASAGPGCLHVSPSQ